MDRFTALAGLSRSTASMSPKELEDVELERKIELFELDYVLPGTVDALSRLVAHHLARHLRDDVRRLKLYRQRRRTKMHRARTSWECSFVVCWHVGGPRPALGAAHAHARRD